MGEMTMSEDDTSGATLELATEAVDNPELSNQGGDDGDGDLAKRLKDTQAKLHEVTTERAREKDGLIERLAKLEGMIEATRRTERETPQDNPLNFLDDPTLKEKFYEDADAPIGAIKRVAQEIAKVFPERDKHLLGLVEKMISEKLEAVATRSDPAVNETIAALRRDPDFAKMDDKTLAVFARKLKRKQKEFPGDIGGSRAGGGVGDAVSTEVEKLAEAMALKMGYGEEG
jgi:hypothetical protein